MTELDIVDLLITALRLRPLATTVVIFARRLLVKRYQGLCRRRCGRYYRRRRRRTRGRRCRIHGCHLRHQTSGRCHRICGHLYRCRRHRCRQFWSRRRTRSRCRRRRRRGHQTHGQRWAIGVPARAGEYGRRPQKPFSCRSGIRVIVAVVLGHFPLYGEQPRTRKKRRLQVYAK